MQFSISGLQSSEHLTIIIIKMIMTDQIIICLRSLEFCESPTSDNPLDASILKALATTVGNNFWPCDQTISSLLCSLKL